MRRLLLLGFAVVLPLLALGEGLGPASATAGTVDTWSGTVDISYNAVLDSASQSYTETIVETIGITLGGPGLEGVVRRSDPDFVIYHQGFEYRQTYKSHIVSKKPTCPDNFVRESEAFGTLATRAPEEGSGPFIVDIDRTFASPAGLEFGGNTGRFETIVHEFGTVGCGAWDRTYIEPWVIVFGLHGIAGAYHPIEFDAPTTSGTITRHIQDDVQDATTTLTWQLTRLPDCDLDGIPDAADPVDNSADQHCGGGKATIIVEKQTLPNGAQNEFQFSINGTVERLQDDETVSLEVPAGSFTIAEALTSGWTVTSIVCNKAGTTTNTSLGSATGTAEPDETIRCVFTNSAAGPTGCQDADFGWLTGYAQAAPVFDIKLHTLWCYGGGTVNFVSTTAFSHMLLPSTLNLLWNFAGIQWTAASEDGNYRGSVLTAHVTDDPDGVKRVSVTGNYQICASWAGLIASRAGIFTKALLRALANPKVPLSAKVRLLNAAWKLLLKPIERTNIATGAEFILEQFIEELSGPDGETKLLSFIDGTNLCLTAWDPTITVALYPDGRYVLVDFPTNNPYFSFLEVTRE